MFKGRSKVLFISATLVTAYFVYLICYFKGAISQTTSSEEALGSAIAGALVMPHMIVMCIGAVFAWLGFCLKAGWSALVAAILYCIATLLFLPYFVFSVPILVLGFVGYAMQKKFNQDKIKEEK